MTKYEDALKLTKILKRMKEDQFGNSNLNNNPKDGETTADQTEENERINKQQPNTGKSDAEPSTPDPNEVYYTTLLKYFNDGATIINTNKKNADKQAAADKQATDKRYHGWNKVASYLNTAAKNGVKSLGNSLINGLTGLAAIPATAINRTATNLSGKSEAQILASTLAYADSLKPMKESDVTLSDREKAYGEKLFNWYSKLDDNQRLSSIKSLNSSQLSTLTKYIAANNPTGIITKDVADALQKLGGSTADDNTGTAKTSKTDPNAGTTDKTNDQSKADNTNKGAGYAKADPNAAQTNTTQSAPNQAKIEAAKQILYGYQPAFDTMKNDLTSGKTDINSLMTVIKNYAGIK